MQCPVELRIERSLVSGSTEGNQTQDLQALRPVGVRRRQISRDERLFRTAEGPERTGESTHRKINGESTHHP